MLYIVASYNCIHFQGKIRKWQKNPLVLGPILVPLTQTWAPKIFSWILPHLDIRNCCKLSLYTIFFKKKLMNQTWENCKKRHWAIFIYLFIFFSKIWLRQPLGNHGQLSCTILDKINDPILSKLSNGLTDGRE